MGIIKKLMDDPVRLQIASSRGYGDTSGPRPADKDHRAIERVIENVNPEAMLVTGLEEALIGFVERFGTDPVALYDKEKIIEILMRDGLSVEEAEEHFSFNIIGAWVGVGTPAFATILRV